MNEGKYTPALSIGLRDFIGTGWYSSEYIVGTKSFGRFELSAGLGFGRFAEAGGFKNPFSFISSSLETRTSKFNNFGVGGTLGDITWFRGQAVAFGSLALSLGSNAKIYAGYNPDPMYREGSYLKNNDRWSYGVSYKFNNAVDIAAQYLHGSELSLTATFSANPKRPPNGSGRELAPVPMRLREMGQKSLKQTDNALIKKVLSVEGFKNNTPS